jgi:hypothetical protein
MSSFIDQCVLELGCMFTLMSRALLFFFPSVLTHKCQCHDKDRTLPSATARGSANALLMLVYDLQWRWQLFLSSCRLAPTFVGTHRYTTECVSVFIGVTSHTCCI